MKDVHSQAPMFLDYLLEEDHPLSLDLEVIAIIQSVRGDVFRRNRKKVTALRERALRQASVFGLFTGRFNKTGDFVLFNPLEEASYPGANRSTA
jgi:hypothetical protein